MTFVMLICISIRSGEYPKSPLAGRSSRDYSLRYVFFIIHLYSHGLLVLDLSKRDLYTLMNWRKMRNLTQSKLFALSFIPLLILPVSALKVLSGSFRKD
jgi:hypothetical protein